MAGLQPLLGTQETARALGRLLRLTARGHNGIEASLVGGNTILVGLARRMLFGDDGGGQIQKARIIAAIADPSYAGAPAHSAYVGVLLRPDLSDRTGNAIVIHTYRYPGEGGEDDLRKMAPLPPMTGQTPPPRDDILPVWREAGWDFVTSKPEAQWWAGMFTGTCEAGAGDAPRGSIPIIQTAVAETLRLLALSGVDVAEAQRLLPQCCGGANGV